MNTKPSELRKIRELILKAAVNGDLTLEDLENQKVEHQHLVLGIPYLESLIETQILDARIDEMERVSSYSDRKWFSDYQSERIAELKTLRGKTNEA